MARQSTTILFRMGLGFSGAISRLGDSTVEPIHLDPANLVDYGLAGKYDGDGKFIPLSPADGASKVAGFLVRPFPSTSIQDTVHQLGEAFNFTGDILKRGYMTMAIAGAPNVKQGAPVFVRVASGTDASPIGSVLTAADGANTVQLAVAYFTGASDDNGVVEIAYNL